jgi:organic radical activating enzyme
VVKFNLFLTARCNWSCDYCFRNDTSVMRKINPETNDRIIQFAPTIAKLTDNVLFTGGELGTIKPSILDFLFTTFKGKKIRVATNGTWFKTPSYKKFKDMDGVYILYHCVQNLKDKIEYDDLYDNEKVKYDFVVTEDNYTDIPYILETYPHITFYPILDLRKSKMPTYEFYQSVYKILQPYKNVPYQIKQAAKVMGGDDKSWIDDCIKIKPFRYRVDFNAGLITSCCLPEVGVQLTEKNVKEVSKKKINLPVDDRVCSYCVVRWLNKTEDIANPVITS